MSIIQENHGHKSMSFYENIIFNTSYLLRTDNNIRKSIETKNIIIANDIRHGEVN